MMILITYDVNTESEDGKRRLQKVAKVCQNYGQRVQKSVFECLVDPAQLRRLRYSLERIIDKEKDSIRYYNLGNEWRNRVEHVGVTTSVDLEGALLL